MVARGKDNAYQVALPGTYNIHGTFNVGDLVPYLDDDGLTELRSIPFKGGGDGTGDSSDDACGDNLILAVGFDTCLDSMAGSIFVCLLSNNGTV